MSLEVDPPAPVKPSDGCSPSLPLDYTLVGDPEPEPPAKPLLDP